MKKFEISCHECGSKNIDVYCTLNEDVYFECLDCGEKERFADYA